MLFSSSEVADYINATFEPAWESIRPAPLVTIDFGNGHAVRRTLQGNIATYVCSPDGFVCDILPGIYIPTVYQQQLQACNALAEAVTSRSGSERQAYLRNYHAREAERLKASVLPPVLQGVSLTKSGFLGGGGGGGIKGGMGGGGGIEGPTENVITGRATPAPVSLSAGPIATHPGLALDTEVGERIRRRLVHQRLSVTGPVRPNEVKAWLYKEVLHADLDDPTLGLGQIMKENYPFDDDGEPSSS